MNNGFSILELLIALTLSMTILSMAITSVTEGASVSKKISAKQDLLESLFFTVDSIKTDLTKCGMRLQEAIDLFNINVIENTPVSFKLTYGLSSSLLYSNIYKGESSLILDENESVKKNKKILIYDPESGISGFHSVSGKEKEEIFIKTPLKHDFIKDSPVILIKEIEYKYFPKQKILKKKVDSGHFQPLLDNVTDFFVAFFKDSNSILYRIEIGNKEQVRGYIFLSNLAGK